MSLQILAALPLTLALFAFTLSRPWAVHHFVVNQQLVQEVQKLGAPVNFPNPHPGDDEQDWIGFIPEYAGWSVARPSSQVLFLHLRMNDYIAVVTTTTAGLHVLVPWIYYHRLLGVDTFYIFVEGKLESPENHFILQTIPGVKVISPTDKLREKQIQSQLWKGNWLLDYQYKPCNYQLYVRQALNLEAATSVAKRAGMKWILHLGVDELIFPGGETLNSLASTLQSFDEAVDLVVFPHYESVVESDNVQDPFTEVTLFKRNPNHLSKPDYRQVFKTVAHNNSRYFLSHADGCLAARVQPGLHPTGPHRWSSALKLLKDVTADEAVALHYTYTKFSDLTSMRSLCPDCHPAPRLARRCFFNEFDSTAFTAAKTLTDEQLLKWYKNHVVWENKTLVYKLIHRSILVRNHIPQIIIQGLREVGFFQDIIEAGREAFEESQMTQKLEVKEMVRRGQEAGKFKYEMASLNFSKNEQQKVLKRPGQDELVSANHGKVQKQQSVPSIRQPHANAAAARVQLNSSDLIPPSKTVVRTLAFALVNSVEAVQDHKRRKSLASIRS